MNVVRHIGVIGGGQLAWMLMEAAVALNLELTIQTPSLSDPAVDNGTRAGYPFKAVLGSVEDACITAQMAETSQVITFENEFVDLPALQQLAERGTCFRPSLSVLAPLLDKYEQRYFLRSLGLPVPMFYPMLPETSLESLGLSLPVVIKARRHGYDGQGTFVIKTPAALQQFWQRFSASPDLRDRFLVEAFVPFTQELAIMAARSATGQMEVYPVVETYQPDQVCRWAIAPAQVSAAIQQDIESMAKRLLEGLDVVGIIGIELFLTEEGQIWVNEIAPRTHNSGHFTIEGCVTSQFTQQLRAVSGLPLGKPDLTHPGAVMVNLLGFESLRSDYAEKRQQLAALPNAHVHWYGKAESRPGRKLGHVTVLLNDASREHGLAVAQEVEAIWYRSNLSGD
jgi:5-(carboxyamino)imidazole ribonucleotide synthase